MKYKERKPKLLEEIKGGYVLINWKMVNTFANLTRDKNPIHIDVDYARKTLFNEPIAQGILSLALISGLMGRTYAGIIYKNQDIDFLLPVRLNTKVRAIIKCVAIKKVHTIYDNLEIIFHTKLEDKEGNIYLSGLAEMFMWGKKK